tara:strand:+ start:890 stop:1009 length:120 start_codon:yes stop_codon:yes gene_type:complete
MGRWRGEGIFFLIYGKLSQAAAVADESVKKTVPCDCVKH